MLQKLSNGAKGGISKFILVGFLFMAVAGLVLTDVGGFFRDGVSSTSVAEVGNESIPYHEFDRFLRSSLNQQNITLENAYTSGRIYDILNRYTQDIIFVQASENMGIRTSDEDVANELHRFVKPYINEETSAQQALDQLLAQQGLSEDNFVNAIRRDLTSNVLKQAILSGVNTATPLLAKEMIRYDNESRDINYISLPHSRIKIEEQPTEEELREFYNSSLTEYRIPERRGFTIAILDPKDISKDITVAEEDTRAFYEDNKERYALPAGRKAEQAIFPSEEAAKEALEKIANGTSFKEAVGNNFRGDNVYEEENTAETLKEIIFADSENKVRGPAQSPLGFHIINDLGNVDASYKPFEEVKTNINIMLKNEQESELLSETLDELNDRIDDGETLETVSNDYNMESLSIAPIDQFGLNKDETAGLKSFENDQADILAMVFTLYEDEISETIDLQDGRVAILKIDNIVEESVKPFETVKKQLTERLISTRQREQNISAVQDLLENIEEQNKTLSDIAKETGATIKTAKNIKRVPEENDPEDVSVNLRARVFALPSGSIIPIPSSEGFTIAQSDAPKLGSVEDAEEAQRLAEQMAIIQTLSTYYQNLAKEIPVQINQPLLRQLYAPSPQS